MPRLLRSVFLLSSLLAACGAAAKGKDPLERITPVPADQPIPLVDFFRPALFLNPALNPDGTMFAAMVTTDRDRQSIVICDIASGKFRVTGGSADREVYSFHWLTADRLLSRLRSEKLYAFGMFVTNVRGIDRLDSYMIERYSVTRTVGVPRKQRSSPIVWVSANAYDSGRDGGLLQIDTTKNINESKDDIPGMKGRAGAEHNKYGVQASVLRSFPVPKGGTPTGYMADHDGELAYGFTAEGGLTMLHRFVDGKWLKTMVDLERIDVVDIGDKPGELLVMEAGDGDKPRAIRRLDVATNTLGETVFQDPKYDFAAPRFTASR